MTGGGTSDDPPQQPPHNDGEFLLRLLQNPNPNPNHRLHQNPNFSLDPAVAAVGPSIPIPFPANHYRPSLSPFSLSPQNPNPNPNFFFQGWGPHHQSPPPPPHTTSFFAAPHQHFGNFANPNLDQEKLKLELEFELELLKEKEKERQLGLGGVGSRNVVNGMDSNPNTNPNRINWGSPQQMGAPPGFTGKVGNQRSREISSEQSKNRSGGFGELSKDYYERERQFSGNPGIQRSREISSSSSSEQSNNRSGGFGSSSKDYYERERQFSGNPGNQRRGFGELSNVGREISSSSSEQSNNRSGGFSSSSKDYYERERQFSSGNPGNQRRSFGELSNVGREISSSSSSEQRNYSGGFSSSSKDYEKERRVSSDRGNNNGFGLSGQIEHPGLPTGSNLRSVSLLDFEESLVNLNSGVVDNEVNHDEVDDLSERLVDSVIGEDESDDKNAIAAMKKNHRDKDFRSDARGKWILSQRMRNSRRLIDCRRDIDRLSAPFLSIYESLIPAEEEKAKQKQLLTLLEKLVCKEWPNARLYLYGSCANSFGVSKSDIDVCLAVNDHDVNKSEMLLKLADILQSGNLQNVQALTRARVPIVKLMDPVTGISCDICINNVLAVVNSKLLRDYAEIDVRLRQLAFLVKHWAKSRGVNETYQGTLSSYAYVLMCIHFLQQRNPPILPCLQGMEPTYAVTVDDINCAFFDRVEKLRDFGSRNRESIAHLVWGFFNYWAYCHDYANNVISVRAGSILSKHEKDWTRRIGNDRHLICIEDPFETSHDLGRVVDKNSIRVLREEFERAAEIMQYDPNPCVSLFDRYIPS